MILILADEARVARALASELRVAPATGHPFFLASGDEFTIAEVGQEIPRACGLAGYLTGSVAGSILTSRNAADGARRQEPRALVMIVSRAEKARRLKQGSTTDPPEHSGPLIALKVAGSAGSFYPDPLCTTPLSPGEIRSDLLSALLSWGQTLFATDQLYPVLLASSTPEAVGLLRAFLERLVEELPEETPLLSSHTTARLETLCEKLRLTFSQRSQLKRELRDATIRRGKEPRGLEEYAETDASTRGEREALFRELVKNLRREDRE